MKNVSMCNKGKLSFSIMAGVAAIAVENFHRFVQTATDFRRGDGTASSDANFCLFVVTKNSYLRQQVIALTRPFLGRPLFLGVDQILADNDQSSVVNLH